MKKYVCSVCGYIYDEAKGIPEAGIAPGTRWEDLPANWKCPLCGASKSEFREVGVAAGPKKAINIMDAPTDLKELFPLEMSILCSNESQARNKYTYFAHVAQQEGYEQLADIFLHTAHNEQENVRLWFQEMGHLKDTAKNLLAAAEGENYEWIRFLTPRMM